MAAPTNISAATATALGPVPVSLTQTVDDAGTTYTVWYAYTALAGETVIGLFAYGDAVNYLVRTKVWIGPIGAPVAWLDFNTVSSLNDVLQIPVVAGQTYYFEFSSWSGDVSPALLTLVMDTAVDDASIVGDICINAETEGYPLVVLNATTGAVKRFVSPFPTGEYAATLPNGVTCVEDKFAATVSVFLSGGVGAELAQISLGSASSSQPSIVVGSNRTDRFYLGRSLASATSELYSMTTTRSDLLGSLPVTPLQALAADLTDTVLYYATLAYAAPIAAYDLTTGLALPDLAAGIAGYLVQPDLFVMADGSILACYVRNATTNPSTVVKRYSAAGATLNTYNFNWASVTTVRMALALDDPDSFWLKRHRTGGQVTYYNIQVSDGAELSSLTGAEFNNGVALYNFPLDGALHYGNAASCAFWLVEYIGTPVPPWPPSGPTPTPDDEGAASGVRYVDIRRLRRGAHLSDEQKWLFHRRFQLDLETGVGLNDGQGSDPTVMLRWSDDGGHTWSHIHPMSAGRMGQFRRRAIWRQMGRSRDRIYEVTVSDPVAWNLMAAYIDVDAGTS